MITLLKIKINGKIGRNIGLIIIIIIANNRSRNRLVKRGDMRDKIEFAFLCNPLKERFIRDILERFRNKFNERVRNLLANQFKQEQRGGGCV